MSRSRPLSVALVALIALAVACGGAAAPTATTAPTATATRAAAQPTPSPTLHSVAAPSTTPTPQAITKQRQVGTLTYVVGSGGFVDNNFDPAQYRSSGAMIFMDHLYDSMVEPDLDYRLVGGVGETWTISPDGLSWTFKVRKGVKAHDGTEMTSADAANAYLRYIKAEYRTHSGAQLRSVFDRIDTPDPSTVIYRFKVPFTQTLVDLAKQPGNGPGRMYPKKFFPWKEGNDRDQGLAAFEKAVGTGPFRLTKHVFDQVIEMEAVPEHYREAARIQKLVLLVAPDATTQVAMLKTGEADMMAGNLESILESRKSRELKVFETPESGMSVCQLYGQDTGRYDKHPFQDIKVRQALNYAVDKQAIIDALGAGIGKPTGQYPFTPIAIGYDPDLKPFPYDPARARQLLEAAGYPRGFETDFHTTAGGKASGELLQKYLGEAGIKLNIKLYDAATLGSWSPKHARGEFTHPPGLSGCGLVLGGGTGRPDMSSLANVFAHSGERGTYGAVANADVDKYLEIQESETNPIKRHELMREANRAMHNNAVFLYMHAGSGVQIVRQRVLEWSRIKGNAYPVHFEGIVIQP